MTDNCKHVVKIKTSIQLGILSPERWHCNICNTTESVWACLSCTNFACGRYISEHALQHFQTTGHPLCIEVNEKFVFCYICDDFVLNDNAPGDIKLLRMSLDAVTAQNFEELSKQRRGRRLLRYHMRDAKRTTLRLLRADDIQTAVMRHRFSRLSWALRLWWSHYLEKKAIGDAAARLRVTSGKRKLPLSYSSAFTGLRNLGNTCYMNSVLQVLRHTASFANFILSHSPAEVLPNCRKRRATKMPGSCGDAEMPEHLVAKRASLCPPVEISGSTCESTPQPSVKMNPPDSNCISSTPLSCTPVFQDPYPKTPQTTRVTDRLDLSVKAEAPVIPDAIVGGLNGGRCAEIRVQEEVEEVETQSDLTSSASHVTEEPSSVVVTRSLYEELYAIFRTLWSGQRTVVSPSSLLYTIWSTLPSFKGYRQQDAQEFLSVFLDHLQSELHGNSRTVSMNSRDFVNRTFQGHCVSHVRCADCNVVACTEEPFSELSLALPLACYTGDATECELVDLLRQFFSPTPIDGASYACGQCNRKLDDSMKRPKVPPAESGLNSAFDSCTTSPKRLAPFQMEKLVSVSLSRLSSPPSTGHSPTSFSSYGMKARHFPATRTVSTNSTSTASSSTSSSSSSLLSESALHSAPSPSRSPSLDESDEISGTPGVVRMETPKTPATVSSSPGPQIPVIKRDDQPHTSELSQPSPPHLTSATQTIRLTRLPRVLRLHIKRFRWIGRQREKVGCHVSFPLILDLSEYMLNATDRVECNRPHVHDLKPSVDGPRQSEGISGAGGNVTGSAESPASCSGSIAAHGSRRFLYHLTGVIVHHGRGFQSGHYTAYCLNDQPECWLNCNDANVSLCDFTEVAAAQAYLLFYSELMPTSPYPTWFNGFSPAETHLKRSQSNMGLSRLSLTGPLTPSTVTHDVSSTIESKSNPTGLKRTASTPSHTIELRSSQSKRTIGPQSDPVPSSSTVVTTATMANESGVCFALPSGVSDSKTRVGSKRSATSDTSS